MEVEEKPLLIKLPKSLKEKLKVKIAQDKTTHKKKLTELIENYVNG